MNIEAVYDSDVHDSNTCRNESYADGKSDDDDDDNYDNDNNDDDNNNNDVKDKYNHMYLFQIGTQTCLGMLGKFGTQLLFKRRTLQVT